MLRSRFTCLAATAVALVVWLTVAIAPLVAAATPVDVPALRAALTRDLDDYVRERSAAEHLTSLSLSLSLAQGGEPIDVAAGTTATGGPPITTESLYQIGSNTKAFTAVAVLQLEAQGRLSIDAPIGDYLPHFPAYRSLTLRRLLNMTSGLESYDTTPAWEAGFARDPAANVAADALIRLVYPEIRFAPGSRYHYSNTGYLLAQEIVEARSASKSYPAEIKRIIASAGLHDTYYTSHLLPPDIARRVVAGYYENDDVGFGPFLGADMSGYSLSWAQGAGAIVSTPRDLSRWARALYQGTQLLPPAQRAELFTLVSTKTGAPLAAPTGDDPAGFGLGVAERLFAGIGPAWFYQGETLGYRAVHLYFPGSDMVLSIFANSRPTESQSKLEQLFSTLYATITSAQRGSEG